jgi:hypothetical protein
MYINSLLKLLNEGSIDDLLTPMSPDEVPGNWVKNPDGSYDVKGDVNLAYQHLNRLPYKFDKVSGNFDCSFNKLTSLKGSPEKVGGNFYCSYNQLTSLKGAPKEVGGGFYCHDNKRPFTIEDVKKVCKVGNKIITE